MTTDTVIEQLRRIEPWNALPESAWLDLCRVARPMTVPKHKIIFHQAEQSMSLYFVISGLLKLSKTAPQGKDTVISLAQPGDIVGEQLLNGTGCYAYRAQTLAECVLLEMDADWVQHTAHQCPAFGWTLCRYLLDRLDKAEERLLRYRFNLTRQRIGFFLKEMALHHANTLANGEIEIRLPLTHELISEMVNVSRQQVTTILKQWAREGNIRYSRHRILLSKPERL